MQLFPNKMTPFEAVSDNCLDYQSFSAHGFQILLTYHLMACLPEAGTKDRDK